MKRLTRSQVGEQRDAVISGYIANDILGCASDIKQGVWTLCFTSYLKKPGVKIVFITHENIGSVSCREALVEGRVSRIKLSNALRKK